MEKPFPRHGSPSRPSAFTLVEVLISTTILALVVIMLSQLLSHVGKIWLSGQAQVEKNEGGRAVLEFITKELEAAQLPVSRTDLSSLQLVINPAEISADYKNPHAIFWQAPLATDQTYGDLAEIGYFVQWDDKKDASNPSKPPRANLCRFFVNPASPTDTSSHYKIFTDPARWVTNDDISAVAPADEPGNYTGLFVENVIGLWATPLDSDGNAISKTAGSFDSRGVAAASGTCTLPAAIDLSFVMLDNHSASRMTTSLQQSIKDLAAETPDANAFVATAQANPAFKSIIAGLRPCKARIYLHNSK